MGYELKVPHLEEMKLKAKNHLEGLKPEEFKNIEELVSYVYYLHVASAEYLEILAEILEKGIENEKR